MRFAVIDTLSGIPAADWNRLQTGGNPFLRHEFLATLERTGCTSRETGWHPQHLVVYTDSGDEPRLIGAVPLYLKSHSYGEYVFDWAWANAYAQAGLNYYPKLVAGVPFTPVTGPRLLIAADQDRASIARLLISGALELAEQRGVSSLHWLFTPEDDAGLLEQQGHLRRTGYQFHWRNRGYADFDDFLASLSSPKRKKIRRERRYVHEAGIRMTVLTGDALAPAHWDRFYQFYRSTVDEHGAIPYLSHEFFRTLGETMPESTVLILAQKGEQTVAGALYLRGEDSLYGRYWGSMDTYHSLHFETCYYQAIEYCIKSGLRRFEAGAQGEHKLSRGFLPTATFSAHWLSQPEFSHAVSQFLERERNGVEFYLDELHGHSPYRRGSKAGAST